MMEENATPSDAPRQGAQSVPFPVPEYYLRGYRNQAEFEQDLAREKVVLINPFPASSIPLGSFGPPQQQSTQTAFSSVDRTGSFKTVLADSDAVPQRPHLSSNLSSQRALPVVNAAATLSQSNYHLDTALRRKPCQRGAELMAPRSLTAVPGSLSPSASLSAVSASTAFRSLSPKRSSAATSPQSAFGPGNSEAGCSSQGPHKLTERTLTMTAASLPIRRHPTASASCLLQAKPAQSQKQNVICYAQASYTAASRKKTSRGRPVFILPPYGPLKKSPSTIEWTARLWYARHPLEARREHLLALENKRRCLSLDKRDCHQRRTPYWYPDPFSSKLHPLLFSCRIQYLPAKLWFEREKAVWIRFKKMLNANPNVLIDRHLRAQQKALPPSSHLNIHICRGHIYFQSIIILLAPGDLAMHSLGKVLVGDILYDMTQSCNLLTAYTFDDIYVGLHNFYNHYPQHFLKSTQGTVTAEQLVDFRCGNPFDSRAGPWSWPQRLPSYLHESCQWTEVPNARIFASVSSPYQAELVVDVQCKRISGSDLLLAGMCGVHHSVFNALDGKKKVARYCSGHIEAKVAGGESSIDCVALPVGGVNDKVKRQMGKSFVYIVRLVSRSATMGKPCGGYLVMRTGGWVVPPMEERLRLYERDYSPLQTSVTCSTAASTVDSVSLPKPGLSRAVQCPLLSLYCNYQPANLCQGQTPEVWTRLADPAVEDVLWMASKLITGTLYKGFRKGAGTGLASQLPMNRVFLRLWEERIRYSSPSSSALARSDLLYQAHLAGHTRLD